jgi:hypothetical protein
MDLDLMRSHMENNPNFLSDNSSNLITTGEEVLYDLLFRDSGKKLEFQTHKV